MPRRADLQLIGIALFGVVALFVALFGQFSHPPHRYRWLFELLGPERYRIFGHAVAWIVFICAAAAFWFRWRFLARLRRYALSRSMIAESPIVEHQADGDR